MADSVKVAIDALRDEATAWDKQSGEIGGIAARGADLHLAFLESVPFFMIIYAPYNELVNKVVGRCQDGERELAAMATALRRVADVYEDEELKGIHEMRNLR